MKIYIYTLAFFALSVKLLTVNAQTIDIKDAGVYVSAQGQSINKEEALKKALIGAVENAAGVFVINKESFSTNIHKQEISSLSSGYVKQYQITDETKDNEGVVTVTVRALVLIQPLLRYSDITSNSEQLNGNSIFATIITNDNLEQSKLKLLQYINDYKPKFNTRVLSQILDPDTDKKIMNFILEVRWDQNYIENLKTIFKLISIESCSGDIDKFDEKSKRTYNLPPPCHIHRKFNKQNNRIVETKIQHSKTVSSDSLSFFQKLDMPSNLPKYVSLPLKEKDEYYIWDNKKEKCFTNGIESQWKKFNLFLYDSAGKIKFSTKENAQSAEWDVGLKNFISNKFFSERLVDRECGIRADSSEIYLLRLELKNVMNILPSITKVDVQLVE